MSLLRAIAYVIFGCTLAIPITIAALETWRSFREWRRDRRRLRGLRCS